MVSQTLAHYKVIAPLGKGGMGEVYLAEDKKLDRKVALKVLPAEMAADPERLARFQREARAVAALNHPNIVTIYSVEEADGVHFLTMELVEGRPLTDTLREEGLSLSEFLEIAIPLSEALAAAHAKGITHRDIKPPNVMITSDGRIKVLDFGLAKMAPRRVEDDSQSQLATEARTREGMILGTAPYMSPEQVEGRTVDPGSDIFSLGIVLFEMATGERPFRGRSAMSLLSSILKDEPPSVAELKPELPKGLSSIIRRCLAKDPDDRYRTATELLEALTRVAEEETSSSAPRLSPLGRDVETERTHRTPLASRDDELAQLVALVDRAREGKGGLVTLVGEPGVGKTRLTQELLTRARGRGSVTIVGHCYEGEGAQPYGPWIEILERASHIAPRTTLRELLGDGAPEIAKLLPELRQLFPDLAPPLELPPEQSRSYLFRCFREFVERAARLQPTVLVLEDLHWADDATLLLLEHLATHLAGLPLLVVGTYRDVELEVSRPLAKSLRQLVRERLVEKIALRRLPQPGVAAMLEGLAGRAVPPALVARIHDETEGNPFFVEEVYLHLEEEGFLFDSEGAWREDLSEKELDVPEGVRLVVGRRLERLSDEGRRALTAAAVIGRRFDFDLLQAVSQVDPDVLLDAVEESERLGLIEPAVSTRRREARYGFSHELIRQTLLGTLSLPRRQRLHLRVAEAIEQTSAEPAKVAPALAHHLFQAGAVADEEKTIRFLSLAGEQALDKGAFEDAMRSFQDALSLVEGAGEGVRADLLRKRGVARQSLGLWQEAIQDWQEALPLFEKTADIDAITAIGVDAAYLLMWQARGVEAAEMAQRALDSLDPEASTQRARLLGICGAALSMKGDFEVGEELTSRAVTMAEELADPHLLGGALLHQAYHLWLTMTRGKGFEVSLRAAELLRSAGDAWKQVDAMAIHQFGSVHAGRLEGVARYEEESEPLAERLGHLGAQTHGLLARTVRDWLVTGDLEHTEKLIHEVLDLLRRGETAFYSVVVAWQSTLYFWRGQWEEARDLAAEALGGDPRGTAFEGINWTFLFLHECYLGNEQAAHALLADCWDRIPHSDQPTGVGAWQMLFAAIEGLSMLGEREKAAELYPAIVAATRTGTLVSHVGHRLLETVAGIAAACGRQWEQGETHYQRALDQASDIPFKSEQPEVRRFYAQMLIERDAPGDRDKARQLLEEAIVSYREMGMPKHLEMAEELLRECA